MKNYLFSAVTTNGDRVIDWIAASSVREALDQLKTRGFSGIELHTDDLTSWSHPGDEKGRDSAHPVSAKLQLQLLTARSRRHSFSIIVLNAFRQNWRLELTLVIIIVVRRAMGVPWGLWDAVAVCAGLFVFPLLCIWFGWRMRVYHRVQRAAVEGRWHEVLRLGPRLEKALNDYPKGCLHAAQWRAKALAALGRLSEALVVMSAFRPESREQEIDFLIAMGSVFNAGRQFEDEAACYRKITVLAPDSFVGWLGLTEILLLRFHKPEEALAAFDRLNSGPMSDFTREVADYLEGAISLAEGHFTQARRSLERAVVTSRSRSRTVPIATALLRIQQTLLAVSCAGTGDARVAQKLMSEIMPFLRVHREGELLERWKSVLTPDAAQIITAVEM